MKIPISKTLMKTVTSFYEETLPDNIIDDADKNSEFVHYNHKNIKDINIAIKHKPLYFGETPVIAVVIDDMGVNVGRSRDIIRLKAPLTSSFLTYGPKLQNQIEAARAAGHEIMAHVRWNLTKTCTRHRMA